MKTLKALSLSFAAAAALAGTASAQTVIHIAGSTAFRAPTTAAIVDYLATAGGAHSVYAGYTGSLLGNSQAIIANGTIGSGGTATTIVETYWTGSLSGVVDLRAGNDSGTKYIDPATMGSSAISAVNTAATVTGSGTTSGYTGGALLGTTVPVTFTNSAPDLAMSDSAKSTITTELLSTGATQTATIGSFAPPLKTLANACSDSTVLDSGATAAAVNTVGVLGFEWVVGNIQTSTDIPSNIDQQTAHSLITNGFVAQSQLTGTNTTADSINYFYFTGRNEDSGTRIEYLSESQNGLAGSAPVIQFAINSTTAAVAPVTNAFEWPGSAGALNTEPNITWNTTGHSGYATGGNVASVLEGAESNTPFTFTDGNQAFGNSGASYFISSLGVTDASTAIGAGAHALTYNGVPFSIAAIQNGQYTAWSYEHAYHLSGLATAKANIVNGIADKIFTTDADIQSAGTHQTAAGGISAGILYSSMNVSRSLTEGGIITHN